jgi:hypothetical protein
LRAGPGALGDVVFFAAGLFPAVFFATGFVVVTGFVEDEVFFFAAGFFFVTVFFFDGTADLLSSRISGEERQPYCARPDPSDRGARRERDRR